MYIARILYPVKVLGPGNRVGIWFDGCSHACKGCSNPELWEFQEKYSTSIDMVIKLLNTIKESQVIDGFTVTGGDPFEQPEDLRQLLKYVKTVSEDILVYTGYDYSYLQKNYSNILELITVLIDGMYIEEKNDNSFLKGSSNQNIIILDESYRNKYEQYLTDGVNEIQNFTAKDGVISVGIHRAGYEEELDTKITKDRKSVV